MSDSGRVRPEDRPTPGQLEAERLRFAAHEELRREVERLRAENARLEEESAWVRKKLGLPEGTPFASGAGPTLAGTMHIVCSHAHGYEAYIAAYRCEDKQGEIARLLVKNQQLTDEVNDVYRAHAEAGGDVSNLSLRVLVREVNREYEKLKVENERLRGIIDKVAADARTTEDAQDFALWCMELEP